MTIARVAHMLKLAPLPARQMKRLIRIGLDGALPTALSLEQEVLFRLCCTQDASEGSHVLVEKRDHVFKGL